MIARPDLGGFEHPTARTAPDTRRVFYPVIVVRDVMRLRFCGTGHHYWLSAGGPSSLHSEFRVRRDVAAFRRSVRTLSQSLCRAAERSSQ